MAKDQTNGQTLLLDTNVWLDYFDQSRVGFASAVALIRLARQEGIDLLIAPTSCKDFYYQCALAIKRDVRRAGREVTREVADAAEEYAWGCLQSITEIATVASMGLVDVAMSRTIHRVHRDFEDDLIVAVATRCQVTYLVTGDRRLAADSPVPTLNVAQVLKLLSSSAEQQTAVPQEMLKHVG